MSRKITKSILSIDEVNLLLNSEEPKNTGLYGNLYEVLNKIDNRKAITIEELSELDQTAKGALSYNKKNLMDTVVKEWYAERSSAEDPNKKVRCGLCNTPNRYLFYIKNRKNGITLNVGSHCITKFPGIEGYLEQKKQLAEIQRNQKRVARRNEFYIRFEDPELTISEAENYLSSLPILLPYNIYSELEDTIRRMRLIYNKYVDDDKKAFESKYDVFELFKLAVNQFGKLKVRAENFVKENENDPISCRRREIDWLISQNKSYLIKFISENNGKYTEASLKQICSYDFAYEYFDLFKKRNKSKLYRIDKFEKAELIFSFNKFGYNPPLIYSVPLSDFMLNIGAKCILNNDFLYGSNDIHEIAKLRDTSGNLVSILNYIDNMINRMNCVFLIDNTTNSLILYRKGDRAIRYFNKYKFLLYYNKYVLTSDLNIQNALINLIKGNKNTSWIDMKKQEKQGINDKINRLYKEYRAIHANINFQNVHTIEIMLYNTISKNQNYVIDFNNPEFISFKRKDLKIGDNKLRLIDFGIQITNNNMSPFCLKDDVLLLHVTTNISKEDIIFYETESGMKLERVKHNSNSIFEYINADKKSVKSYGIVICTLNNYHKSD